MEFPANSRHTANDTKKARPMAVGLAQRYTVGGGSFVSSPETMNRTLTRRAVLRGTLAGIACGAGSPRFVPSSVLGFEAKPAANDRVNLAFIGLGNQGLANLSNPYQESYNLKGGFIAMPDARVVAVCDVDAARLQRGQRIVNDLYGTSDCAATPDFREILARRDVDAVVISTPDHWHAAIGIAAARAGKDVYSEKPLAHNLAEGRAICDVARRYGTVWQTGSQQRSWATFRRACELVRSGRIGEVKTVRVALPAGGRSNVPTTPVSVPDGFDYDRWLGPAPWAPYCNGRCHGSFRSVSDYSSGPIADWAGHHADIALWGMGADETWPIEVAAEGEFNTAGLFDNMLTYRIECRYARGFSVVIEDNSRRPEGKDGVRFSRCCFGMNIGVLFEGSAGWIQVNRGGMDSYPESVRRSLLGPNDVRLYRSDDHKQNFLDSIRSRRPTVAPPHVAHHSIGAAYLGVIAMRLKRPLRWDAVRERFAGDDEADRMLSRPMRSPWCV
jgi:predicted dehydrogenase